MANDNILKDEELEKVSGGHEQWVILNPKGSEHVNGKTNVPGKGTQELYSKEIESLYTPGSNVDIPWTDEDPVCPKEFRKLEEPGHRK